MSKDSHLLATRLARSDRYDLCVQNETPSLHFCILLSCSMSYTVRKACLNDWCQAQLTDVDVLNVKVSTCQSPHIGGTRVEGVDSVADRDGFDPS